MPSRDWLEELQALAHALEHGLPLPGCLRCVECGIESEGSARGWRALRAGDDEVATYCPKCARAEFSQA